jgi:GTP-binding protein Era
MTGAVAHRAGLVAIVGRPNTGKSTLLNRLVGQKISITSRRPQTTRHRILGIVTRPHAQLVFVDTPGLQARHASLLNREMNRTAAEALAAVDAVLVVVEAMRFGADDERVLAGLPAGTHAVLAVNKVDRVRERARLLPFIDRVSRAYAFRAIVPVSAKTGYQLEVLLDELRSLLPEGGRLYPEGEITDRSERFLAAELIREKLFRLLGEEVPYAIEVQIDRFEERAGVRRIRATVLVDKPGQKAIVIGEGGARLKQIATQARLDMEKLFAAKVFLEVWVKVKRGWMDDAATLRRLGYD